MLVLTEVNFKIQLFAAIAICVIGLYLGLSSFEWMLQFLAIGLVLVAEALNTAIEKLADQVHKEQHKDIGLVKDIAAAAPAIAALTALIIAAIIYLPKIT